MDLTKGESKMRTRKDMKEIQYCEIYSDDTCQVLAERIKEEIFDGWDEVFYQVEVSFYGEQELFIQVYKLKSALEKPSTLTSETYFIPVPFCLSYLIKESDDSIRFSYVLD